MTELRRKMTAYVLAAALVVLLVPVRAWAGIKPVEINKNSNATPIHPVEMQVTVGDLVLLAVNNDNFEWEDEDENVVNGSDEAFTMQMVRELGLVVYPPSVDPHFGMPELVVEQGKLYIAAEALLPSAGTVLAVGLMDKTRGQIEPCAVPVAILQKDSGGSGGEEPGGGDDGDGNDGGDEGSGGNGGEAPGDGGSGGDGANGSDGGDPEPGERPETTEGLSIGGFSDGFELRRRLGAASAVTRTGGVIHIPFQAGDFQWYDALGRAVEPEDTAVVTLPQIKAAGLEVRLTGGERQAVVEAVYLAEEGGSGGVAVRLVERLLSLEDVSFIAQLVVSCNGVYSEGALQGLVEIPIETPDNSIGWLDLQEGIVVQPEEQIADIQLYLGGGVTMRASLEQGGRYSGIALREAVNGAAGDVESVCSLYLLGGLEQRGVFVIEHEAARYIYDDEGAYLGMSGEELPYRALYYISTVEPDGGDGNGGSGSGSGSGSGGSGGSSGAYKHPSISSVPERFYNQESTTSMTEPRVPAGAPANANDNPSTGK